MHTHAHGDDHRHAIGRRLIWATGIILFVLVAEVIGAAISHSVALLSDAFHMFVDASALMISLAASRIAVRPPTMKKTYGYRRIETVAALVNGVVLAGVILMVVVNAAKRLIVPVEVLPEVMTWVGAVGLMANVVCLLLLRGHHQHSANVHSAFLHVVGDTLSSVAVVAGGWAIYVTRIWWIDSVISLGIAAYLLWNVYRLIRGSVSTLLDSVPEGIDLKSLQQDVMNVHGVASVHDLHVAGTRHDGIICSIHVVPAGSIATLSQLASMTEEVKVLLAGRYGIPHVVIQADLHDDGQCFCSFDQQPAHVQ